jgi:hypothetical protein
MGILKVAAMGVSLLAQCDFVCILALESVAKDNGGWIDGRIPVLFQRMTIDAA